MVNAKVNDLNAAKELGTLPDMKSSAVNILIEHRNDKMGYNLSKVENARLGRWTSVGYAEQVVGSAGTTGALTTLVDAKSGSLRPKTIFVLFLMRKGACEIAQIPHKVLLCVLLCFQ